MNIVIKNNHIQELLNMYNRMASLSNKEEQEYMSKCNNTQLGEYLIMGYVADMLRNSAEINRELDLSYDTVENITPTLNPRFREICEMKNPRQSNALSLAKSLASYLFLLAMNEHNCTLKVNQMATAIIPASQNEGPLWGGVLRIKTGIRRELDYLPAVIEGVQMLPVPSKPLLMFTMNPVIRAYRSSTGIDLTDRLIDIAFEV